MTNRPIYLHGYSFEVAGTDGGWIPSSARWPEVTVEVAAGEMRAIEFTANRPGDWAFHCHKSHHTMNAIGHQVPNRIGVPQKDLAKLINKLVPDHIAMGSTGGSIGAMEMPLPENTLPMMTGTGPFCGLEMGGMFSVVKVREGLGSNDYRDPSWFGHPKGTVAFEYTGDWPDS
jgi:hypothetical protein